MLLKLLLKSRRRMLLKMSKLLTASRVMVIVTSISVDGAWHRRGFSSLHGAVVAISMSTGKVATMSRYCQGCTNINALEKNNKLSPDEVMILRAGHDCLLNHVGSVPAMETEGAIQIFNRSEENGLIYNGYYGDGDSKAYELVKETYPGIPVLKYECIGHVQKHTLVYQL